VQGFESSYRRHLAVEQRRAILEAIAETLDPEATVGDVLDAAERLGWGDQIGAFSLAEIAAAMTPHDARPALEDDLDEPAEDELAEDELAEDELADDDDALEDDDAASDEVYADEDDEELEPEDEEDEYTRNLRALLGPERLRELERAEAQAEPVAEPARTKKKGGKKKSKKAAKVQARKAAPEPVAKGRVGKGKAEKGEDGRKRAARLRALRKKIDAEERMSLDEAAELFLPIVTELGQATMQDLEEFTGVGRRKLRFHVGQLVRHEYLERHGMGRGTYYTVG